MRHEEIGCCGGAYRSSKLVENVFMGAVYIAFIWACAQTFAGCIMP